MSKQVRFNDMIIDTINTKKTKTPKYADILKEAYGVELTNNHDWSAYGNWGVKDKRGGIICTSKTYDNRKALFVSYIRVCKLDKINNVDFCGLINTTRPRDNHEDSIRELEMAMSRPLREFKEAKWSVKYYTDNIASKNKDLEKFMKLYENDIKYYAERRISALDKYLELKEKYKINSK